MGHHSVLFFIAQQGCICAYEDIKHPFAHTLSIYDFAAFFSGFAMNRFPEKTDLKTPAKESHNQDSCDERMIALVRFLARCAAEEDYRMYQEARRPPDKTENGD